MLIRKCEGCKKMFEYEPPHKTVSFRRFCDACIEIRRKEHYQAKRKNSGFCRICNKAVRKYGGETCGVICRTKLARIRARADCPVEPALQRELQQCFTWDCPNELGL